MVTDTFLADALSSAQDNAMSRLRLVTVPARTYYMARAVEPEMKAVAGKAFDNIITALTRQLSSAEAAGGAAASAGKTEKVLTFSGKTYREAFDTVNDGFLSRHWADGLPIIPPTQEAVAQMLCGTSRRPDEVIGVPVAAKGGIATVEKIAINAVMAGAKPEYLPVIIAAMEVLTSKEYNLLHLQASASSSTPVIFVNGPIAAELGIVSGQGFLGHGNKANNTIGRAVRLCLINLGHMWPGVNDMGLTGRAAAFGNWTFAENEADSPWKPYHVDLGFKPEDSTVTVSTEMVYRIGPGGAVNPMTPYECLIALGKLLGTMEYPILNFASRAAPDVLIAMGPDLAQRLSQMGFAKADLKRWLYERARVPYAELSEAERKNLRESLQKRTLGMQSYVEAGSPGEMATIPAFKDPESIRIVVAGGSPAISVIWKYDNNRGFGTRLIHGATLTDAGK